MGKIMEKFTDSVARKIWNQMEEEQRKCKESKIQTITEKQIKEFGESLYETEHSDNTIQRYCQEVRKFMEFLDGRVPEKQLFVEYRDLEKKQYNVRSVNVKISAINAYFVWSKRPELKMHFLKIQKKAFISEKRQLSSEEFSRLLTVAQKKSSQRLYMLLQVLVSTGIRISELPFITVESVEQGEAEISLKGKTRSVKFQNELRKNILEYCRKNKIESGYIFRTRNGKAVDRSNVYHEMKKLCEKAGVEKEKVFPHNMRHLFARIFYHAEQNLAHLADVLGHSSIETTRIYVAETIDTYEKILEKMKFPVQVNRNGSEKQKDHRIYILW